MAPDLGKWRKVAWFWMEGVVIPILLHSRKGMDGSTGGDDCDDDSEEESLDIVVEESDVADGGGVDFLESTIKAEEEDIFALKVKESGGA